MFYTPSLVERIETAAALAERLRDAPATPSGYASVRPAHMDPVLDALEAGVAQLVAEGSPRDPLAASRLLALARAVTAHPAAEYVGVRHRARIAAARIHAFRHDWPAAGAAIGDLVFRPQTACEDMHAVRAAMLLDRMIRPNLIAAPGVLAALFVERLLFLMARFTGTRERLDLVEAFGPQLALLLGDAAVRAHVARASNLSPEMLAGFPPALAYLRVRRHWPSRTVNPRQMLFRLRAGQPFRAMLGALITAADQRVNFGLSESGLARVPGTPPSRGVLVTRGMGGAGDVVMMLPGIVALARRVGRPVDFAVPPGLMALLAGIPEIVPLDSAADVTFEDYERWYNLGECPAGRYEHDARPNVRRGRIEVFAAALGVRAAELDQSGWSAPFGLDPRQIALRDRIRVEARASGRLVVGIAPFSREEYRRVPALVAAAEYLLESCAVLVLHARQVDSLEAAGLRIAETPDLASLIATIAACDYVIATDTAQLHLAAALGVPTLAIFGPTDGRVRTGAHRNVRLMQQWQRCPAMPCWRNEDLACQLTLGRNSACLADLRAEDVLREFDALVAAHPVDRGAVRPALEAA